MFRYRHFQSLRSVFEKFFLIQYYTEFSLHNSKYWLLQNNCISWEFLHIMCMMFQSLLHWLSIHITLNLNRGWLLAFKTNCQYWGHEPKKDTFFRIISSVHIHTSFREKSQGNFEWLDQWVFESLDFPSIDLESRTLQTLERESSIKYFVNIYNKEVIINLSQFAKIFLVSMQF